MTEYTLFRSDRGLGPTFHEAAVVLKMHKDLVVKSGVPIQTASGGGIYIIETKEDIAKSLPEKLKGWKLVPPSA